MSNDLKQGLNRIGGEEAVGRWMTLFYDQVARHPVLAPLFTADLNVSREKQTAYMIEFLGGPANYTETYGKPFLRFRHRHVKIGQPERDAWFELFMGTLREVTEDQELIRIIEAAIAPIADAMINHKPDQKDAYFFN